MSVRVQSNFNGSNTFGTTVLCLKLGHPKNWDKLENLKIIILADPKNWIILRKRKNIRNFSDPKNWDGVFGALE